MYQYLQYGGDSGKLGYMADCCQETTVKEAKQCQMDPVVQDTQRLDNRAVELSPLDCRV